MTNPSTSAKDHAKAGLILALRRFIARQHLVAQALKDLGVHLDDLATHGSAAWQIPAAEYLESVRAYAQTVLHDPTMEMYYVLRRAQSRALPQTGTWHDCDGQLWTYFLHGKGCELRNPQTAEAIDWNSPHLQRFDLYFFSAHLAWQLEQAPYQAELAHLRAHIAQGDFTQEVRTLLRELTERAS
ncbi:MAG: hypothetical protein HC822_17900 [Oscillochloris sp.]|nr:hypothetical protein [Oscillochloris sp.]